MNPQQPSPMPTGSGDDNIFLTKVAPPPTPEEKKKTALVVTISLIIGFAILIVGIFMLLFLGANSAASGYRSQSITHIGKMTATIQGIDIDSILNQRDISGSIAKLEELEHDRPRLSSVIFGESLSADYQETQGLQNEVNAYYKKMADFGKELPGLLTFAQATEETHDDLQKMISGKTPAKANEAQTIAGSIDDLSARVKDLTVPAALVKPRDDLAAAYTDLAEGYRDLAASFNDTASSKAQANRRITNATRAIEKLSDSSTFAEKVKAYVDQLVEESKTLANRL